MFNDHSMIEIFFSVYTCVKAGFVNFHKILHTLFKPMEQL